MATPPDFSPGAILTAAQMDKIGMWLVTSATFTAVTVVNVNNVFTSDYRNYRVIVDITASSTNQNVSLRLRASGTDSATTYYSSGIGGFNAATSYFTTVNNGTSIGTLTTTSNDRIISLDFFSPQLARITNYTGTYSDTNGVAYNIGGFHNTASAYDGFTILPGAGGAATLSGNYRVYGYRD